jgi:AraC family transcriptional regulator
MKPDTRCYYRRLVQQTIERIGADLDEATDLDTLAREVHVAPFHFHRIFRGMVGETALELARRLRLERAAWQLAQTTRSVTAIAFDAGFEAHEAFTRAFRAHYDASPTTFRERRYPRTELATMSGVHFHPDGRVGPLVPRASGGEHMDVTVTHMPALRLAAVRHLGPYNQIPVAFARLGELLGTLAAPLSIGPAAMMAIYDDNPEVVPPSDLRSDAAVVVPDDLALPPPLTECVPAGTFACTVHLGPYELLGDTWARFMGEWLPASGHVVGQTPCYEIYANDPRVTPKTELRTELYMPLEQESAS